MNNRTAKHEEFIKAYIAMREDRWYDRRDTRSGFDPRRKVLIHCAAIPGSGDRNVRYPERHDVLLTLGHRQGTRWEYENEIRLSWYEAVCLFDRLQFAVNGDPDDLHRFETREVNRVFHGHFLTLEEEARIAWEEHKSSTASTTTLQPEGS